MQFNKKAATENTDYPVFAPGDYDFDVENVEYVMSKRGVPNWKITMDVESPDNRHVKVFEYFPEQENMQWKFGAFFSCIGWDLDKIVEISEIKDAIGEVGRCRLEVEAGTNGYADRNRVKRFLSKKAEEPKKAPVPDSDDLPF